MNNQEKTDFIFLTVMLTDLSLHLRPDCVVFGIWSCDCGDQISLSPALIYIYLSQPLELVGIIKH